MAFTQHNCIIYNQGKWETTGTGSWTVIIHDIPPNAKPISDIRSIRTRTPYTMCPKCVNVSASYMPHAAVNRSSVQISNSTIGVWAACVYSV